jgi:hypothetical protein
MSHDFLSFLFSLRRRQLLLPALQSLFANYQYGDDQVLPADEVRQVLGALYSNVGKFQV